MQGNDLVARVSSNPTYRKLVHERSRFGWTLSVLMLLVYYGYILLIAFDKELLARPLGDSTITLGIPIGLFVILFTIVVTGIYVRRANHRYDQLTTQLRDEVQA